MPQAASLKLKETSSLVHLVDDIPWLQILVSSQNSPGPKTWALFLYNPGPTWDLPETDLEGCSLQTGEGYLAAYTIPSAPPLCWAFSGVADAAITSERCVTCSPAGSALPSNEI